jgi:hypothetical protein
MVGMNKEICLEQYKKENLLEIIKLLLDAKCNPNEPHAWPNGGLRGYTPLMFAAEFDLADVFDLLVKAGGDVDKRCEYTNSITGKFKTPNCWHIAYDWNSSKVLRYLEKNCKGNGKLLIL